MTETGIDAVRRWMESHRNDIIEDMGRIVNIRSVSEPDSDVLPFGKGCRKVLDTMLELAAFGCGAGGKRLDLSAL